MNWLGRIFYTVLSMSGMMLFLAPLVLLLRFGMRNQEKKFMKWEWWLVYLRSLCPLHYQARSVFLTVGTGNTISFYQRLD